MAYKKIGKAHYKCAKCGRVFKGRRADLGIAICPKCGSRWTHKVTKKEYETYKKRHEMVNIV